LIIYVDRKESSLEAAAFRDAVERTGLVDATFRSRGADERATLEAVSDADVIVALDVPDAMLAAARRVRWLAFWSAGLDRALTPAVEAAIARGVIATNASGVHGPNIAEHVLAMMLAMTRRLPSYYRAQMSRSWEPPPGDETGGIGELTGQTLGIVGLGRVGEALAERARAFGMRVIGIRRGATPSPNSVAAGAIGAPGDLDSMLAESDHVCIAVPLTRETTHLFDERRLQKMRRGAVLYNVARGRIVDEDALVRALQTGHLAGAGLDVFETEPLPASSPLWSLDNVIITPHVAGRTPHYFTRAAALFAANVVRFARGEPMTNRYDPGRGY
jgi:phosphoglycerate dehydrogenase-like enzyme